MLLEASAQMVEHAMQVKDAWFNRLKSNVIVNTEYGGVFCVQSNVFGLK